MNGNGKKPRKLSSSKERAMAIGHIRSNRTTMPKINLDELLELPMAPLNAFILRSPPQKSLPDIPEDGIPEAGSCNSKTFESNGHGYSAVTPNCQDPVKLSQGRQECACHAAALLEPECEAASHEDREEDASVGGDHMGKQESMVSMFANVTTSQDLWERDVSDFSVRATGPSMGSLPDRRQCGTEGRDSSRGLRSGGRAVHFQGGKKSDSQCDLCLLQLGRGPHCVTCCSIRNMQERLRDAFDELDEDGNGQLDRQELRAAFLMIGQEEALSGPLLKAADLDHDGMINRNEWMTVIDDMLVGESPELVKEFAVSMAKFQEMNNQTSICLRKMKKHQAYCILREKSFGRVMWDTLMAFLLFYLCIFLPLMIGFGTENVNEQAKSAGSDIAWWRIMNVLDEAVNWLFIVDMLINFRTTFFTKDGREVFDSIKVAKHYMKTWFFIDLLSSLPIELITAGFEVEQNDPKAVKVLKLGRVVRTLKVFRLGRLLKHPLLLQIWEELSVSAPVRTTLDLLMIFFITCFFCHWLACFMVALGGDILEGYDNVSESLPRYYMAAFYWSMTTMTSVGYGDICPKSDSERIAATVAMFLGGCINAYVIGKVSVVLACNDLNVRAYYRRLDLIHAWLEHHRLPIQMRQRIRSYFREYLKHKSVLNEQTVLSDLPPELAAEVSNHLIHPEVRNCALFMEVQPHILAYMVDIIHQVGVDAGEQVVSAGNIGTAMFIIVEGQARRFSGFGPLVRTLSRLQKSEIEGASFGRTSSSDSMGSSRSMPRILHPGDSFGEELLLGFEREYSYSIFALTRLGLLMIPREDFTERFGGMTDFMATLRENFLQKPGERHSRIQAMIERHSQTTVAQTAPRRHLSSRPSLADEND
eukprot:TRINITY_DN9084_c0_g1_i2.p1 TRINITY_DN9084_c0_g1~~TRINITY_DN9084_c0_g1_i2.p1  ORF type:complete len:873 (-),score=228.69 TRINITY_DN9084_c0_g1_i2:96-2714(-)